MCKQWNQSGADSKQTCHNHERKMQYGTMISCLSQQYSGLHLSPTVPTLPLPLVSPIRVLLANQYTYLISLNLPTILAFSLPSTPLPANPLPLPGSMTLVHHCLAYIPPSTGFYHPSILSYNNCGHNWSLPCMTSYFGLISSHNLPVSQLVSSSPPSSFNLDCSFLFRQCSSHECFTL